MRYMMMAAAALTVGVFGAGGASAMSAVYATKIDSGRLGGTGWDATAQVKTTNRDDAGNALGAPDQVGNTSGGFFSLGMGAVAVFDFSTAFEKQATVFEVTFNCDGPQTPGGLCNYSESVDVYALDGAYTPFDGTFGLSDITDPMGFDFTKVGSIPNGLANATGGATITFTGPFSFLALVDTSSTSGDGFDVDAVSVQPVPLPAAGLLLAAGVGALGLMRLRRRS